MKKREFIQNEMERRLFKTSLIVSILTVIVLFFMDFFYLRDYRSVILEVSGLLVFSTFFVYSGKRLYNQRYILPYLLVLFIILDFAWYLGGGFGIGTALLFMVGISVSLILITGKNRIPMVILLTLNYLTLMLVEYYHPGIRTLNPSAFQELIVSYIFIVITYSMTIYLMVFMKNNYERVRDTLSQQNISLNIQSTDLMDLNRKLAKTNELLEKKVAERTLRVEEQKKKILNYAFMNSHHVRAPLVNILGLTSLYESQILSQDEESYVFEKLKSAADQLNLEFEMVKGHIEKEEWEEKLR